MTTGVQFFPQTLPANTVVGRLSSGAGPTEAIPMAQLAAAITAGLSANTSLQVASVAALRALTPPTSLITVYAQGYYLAGDGGGGIFYWNSADTSTDNSGTIIQPNAGGTGRWNRIYDSGSVYVKWFGAKFDGATDDTAAIAAAIGAITTGFVLCPAGTGNHTGLTLKAGLTLNGVGAGATILNNTGVGANITIPALANRAGMRSLMLTGVAGSTNGLYIEDALWTRFYDVAVNSAGNSNSLVKLNSLNNPSGNGAYFAEFIGLDVNGQNRTGSVGIELTGTSAGANSNHFYGAVIRNCITGTKISKGSLNKFDQPYTSACTTGLSLTGAGAVGNHWYSGWFESNTEHVNIAALAADNAFVFPEFSSPSNTFGSNNGSRTIVVSTKNSGVANTLPGGTTFDSGGVSLSGGDFSVAAGKSMATKSFEETSGHTSIGNTATFDITVPTPRRPQILSLYSGFALSKVVMYLVHGDNSATITVNGVVTDAAIGVAGQSANTVRITNSFGGTADIYWTLTPLGVGL